MRLRFCLTLILGFSPAFATVNLSSSPIWQSALPGYYSTGGAWAFIDGDDYLDFVVSNGNDMQINHNAVYFNQSGMLATTPGWQSDDIAYHGHCDVADYNQDGHLDFASAGYGPPSPPTPGVDRVYRNSGSGLPTAATWSSANSDFTFGLAWGDYDGDGDLDLATASSNDYISNLDKFKIYQNDGGTLTNLPVWESAQTYYGIDVEWADINRDGLLDLVCACSGDNQHELVFLNSPTGLHTTPDWSSGDSGRTIQIAVGDYDADGWLDLAAADNAQLGGDSFIKVYHNNNGTLESTPSWHCDTGRTYYSCVAWADCDLDGYPELAAGGWWEPVVVFENSHGVLNPTPVWSWLPSNPNNLVCETVAWGDMDGSSRTAVTDEVHTANGSAKCFYANHRPLEKITAVKINNTLQSITSYCWHPLGGWISFATAPPNGSSVKISYTYSQAPDLAVANWQSTDHNYVFGNLGNVSVTLTYFEAGAAKNGGALVYWATNSDSVEGFRLWRKQADASDERWQAVNHQLITGSSPYRYHDIGANEAVCWQYALEAITGDGARQRFGPINADLGDSRMAMALRAPAPNPARASVNFSYSCGENRGSLEIRDLAGRLVRRWELLPNAGDAVQTWDLRDESGKTVSNGVYILMLRGGNELKTRRLVVCH